MKLNKYRISINKFSFSIDTNVREFSNEFNAKNVLFENIVENIYNNDKKNVSLKKKHFFVNRLKQKRTFST